MIADELPVHWRDKARCFTLAQENDFLETAWVDEEHPFQEMAKKVCLGCPVRNMCLQDALEDEEAEGIRGGYLFESGRIPVAIAREIRDTMGLKIGPHQSTGRPKR